ncbi:hypothetical protein, partial [Stenotrophomonas maltophilia]|uniref:hypothetical protein n=1 Tax=Stenotrophomonas maltophilia TaxID=40324 RepID=UPI0039E06747
HLLHRFGTELIRVLLAVAHKHLGHCHELWQPDVYERLAGPGADAKARNEEGKLASDFAYQAGHQALGDRLALIASLPKP